VFLHRVIPLHTEDVLGSTCCLPRPFKWSFFGEAPTNNLLPLWYFEAEVSSFILEGLSMPPFEPIEEVSEKCITLKTTFPLTILSFKRFGDIQALSVSPSWLEFSPGMVKAFLHPRPGYVPKVCTNIVKPIVLQAFCPPSFLT